MSWGIKDARISDKLPKLLATADNVSARFAQEMERAVESLPHSVRAYLEAHNQRFVGIRRLSDISELSTGDDTIILARRKYQDNKFFIAEEHFIDGQWRQSKSVAGTTRHEVGHAVNTLAGRPQDWLSERSDFIAAYDRDIAARDEVFSELFALRIGGPANAHLTYTLRRSFPETLRLMGGRR